MKEEACAKDGKCTLETNQDEMRYRFDFITQVHNHVNESIRFADTKAFIIITVCAYLLVLPLTKTEDWGRLIQQTKGWGYYVLFIGLGILLYGSIICAAICCLLCVLPRFNERDLKLSKIFFRDIANYDSNSKPESVPKLIRILRLSLRDTTDYPENKDYLTGRSLSPDGKRCYVVEVRKIPTDDAIHELAEHTCRLSKIASTKHEWIQSATRWLRIGLVFLGLLFIMVYTRIILSPLPLSTPPLPPTAPTNPTALSPQASPPPSPSAAQGNPATLPQKPSATQLQPTKPQPPVANPATKKPTNTPGKTGGAGKTKAKVQ
jgi:hypothetical protein